MPVEEAPSHFTEEETEAGQTEALSQLILTLPESLHLAHKSDLWQEPSFHSTTYLATRVAGWFQGALYSVTSILLCIGAEWLISLHRRGKGPPWPPALIDFKVGLFFSNRMTSPASNSLQVTVKMAWLAWSFLDG
jgi:hypothetical protein